MNRYLDGWCGLSQRGRIACWLGFTLCLLLASWATLLRPAGSRLEAQISLRAATQEAVRQQWRKMILQRAALLTEPKADAVTIFSALDFRHPQARLARWQPDDRGGEMELDAQWAGVPLIFEQLAGRNMRVNAFSLEPKTGALRFTLRLENIDAR